MCTAVLSIEPGQPVLLAGFRDELTDRAWEPPGRYWPQFPELIGGRDLLAGGTWLAVSDANRRVGCVLNGIGRMAPAATRRSRGELPLLAAASKPLDRTSLAELDPFHLLIAEPGLAVMRSWDGIELTERTLPTGVHFVVNSGLASDLQGAGQTAASVADERREPPQDSAAGRTPNGREHERARIEHFLELFRSASRPDPRPGQAVADAWGSWFPLVNGADIGPDDLRALIVRRDLGGGRTWGTTSVSLVSLSPDAVRYDFSGRPGDPVSWYPVL